MTSDKERTDRQRALEARFTGPASSPAAPPADASPSPKEEPTAPVTPARAAPMAGMLCTNCLFRGYPKTVTPGSIIIELFLWFCFLLPGLIYSLWRLSARHKACPSCGARNMIPANSPAARKLLS